MSTPPKTRGKAADTGRRQSPPKDPEKSRWTGK